jgi:hypothetical protein
MNKEVVLSPSSINLFIEEKALWVLKHYYKMYGETNIYAVRGKLAEEVVNLKINKKDPPAYKDYLPHAINKSLFDNVEVSEQDYKDFYNWGCKCHKLISKYDVTSVQDRLEGKLFGLDVAGYIDYKVNSWPETDKYAGHTSRPYYLDLKTVSKCPHILTRGARTGQLPANKAANIRQQVIYSNISGLDTALLFVDEEGNSLHYPLQEQDFIEHEPIIEEAIKKIKKLLTLPIEDVIIETYPKNMNSFFWCDTTRKKAREIWKIKEKKIF